jgi:hypothetical protein
MQLELGFKRMDYNVVIHLPMLESRSIADSEQLVAFNIPSARVVTCHDQLPRQITVTKP